MPLCWEGAALQGPYTFISRNTGDKLTCLPAPAAAAAAFLLMWYNVPSQMRIQANWQCEHLRLLLLLCMLRRILVMHDFGVHR